MTMPRPPNLHLLRSLLGGLSYYRQFLPEATKRIRIRPFISPLKQDVNYFAPAMDNGIFSHGVGATGLGP